MAYTKRDDPVAHAKTGHLEPLARHIEAGGELNADMRTVLVAILREELNFKKGNRRTFAQIQLDRDAAVEIALTMIANPRLSKAGAMEAWLDANPNVSAAALKKMLQRAARDRAERRRAGG